MGASYVLIKYIQLLSLTELVLALHRFGGERWFALSHLVDSGNSELMVGAFLKTGQCELPVHQLVFSSYSCEVVPTNHTGLKNVLGHLCATVILGWSPCNRHGVLGNRCDDEVLWALWDG